jgi:hypothetical protein
MKLMLQQSESRVFGFFNFCFLLLGELLLLMLLPLLAFPFLPFCLVLFGAIFFSYRTSYLLFFYNFKKKFSARLEFKKKKTALQKIKIHFIQQKAVKLDKVFGSCGRFCCCRFCSILSLNSIFLSFFI